MKWFLLYDKHINLDLVQVFQWRKGKLWMWFLGDPEAVDYYDPKAENYIRLCRLLGVTPNEEVISWTKSTL